MKNLYIAINRVFSKMLFLTAFLFLIKDIFSAVVVSSYFFIMLFLTIRIGVPLNNLLSRGERDIALLTLNSVLIKILMLLIKGNEILLPVLIVMFVLYLANELSNSFTQKINLFYILGANLIVSIMICMAYMFSAFFPEMPGYFMLFLALSLQFYNVKNVVNDTNV